MKMTKKNNQWRHSQWGPRGPDAIKNLENCADVIYGRPPIEAYWARKFKKVQAKKKIREIK